MTGCGVRGQHQSGNGRHSGNNGRGWTKTEKAGGRVDGAQNTGRCGEKDERQNGEESKQMVKAGRRERGGTERMRGGVGATVILAESTSIPKCG